MNFRRSVKTASAGHSASRGRLGNASFWRSFLAHWLRALKVILPLALVMFGCEELGLFTGFENAQLDSLLRLHSRTMSAQIVIVEINQEDYDNAALFNGTSPLDTDTALTLIEQVRKYNPSVIGVDLDTSGWLKACTPAPPEKPTIYDAQKCNQQRTRIANLVGNAGPAPGAMKPATTIIWAAVPKSDEPPLTLKPVLGGASLPPDRQGVPQFPIDRDGSVRHYESRVLVTQPSRADPAKRETVFYPTFARAILDVYPKLEPIPKASDKPVIFNFYGDRYRFPLIEANAFLESQDPALAKPDERGKRSEIDATRTALLDGKIVLIGGSFREARDQYFTPLGPMQGVELNALAIQSDLSNGGIREVHKAIEIIADIVVGSLIVFIFFCNAGRPKTAIGESLVIIPIAMIASFLAFKSIAYWFNFIPLTLGVVLHQLFEMTEASSELQREREEVREQPVARSAAQQGNEPVPAETSAAEPEPGESPKGKKRNEEPKG